MNNVHEMHCAEIWGGIKNQDVDTCSAGLRASLYSSSADGGKGGDVYYVSVCSYGLLTRIAIADVIGHGEAVSDVGHWLYEAVESKVDSLEGHEVLDSLNQYACQRGLEALSTAAVVGVYRSESIAYYAYAGHQPVMICRAGSGAWEELTLPPHDDTPTNLPLGVTRSTRYEQATLPVAPGDRLVLYTDGVIEAPNGRGQRFGKKRLREALANASELPLPELKAGVLDAVRSHTGNGLTHDDVTFMAIEVQ